MTKVSVVINTLNEEKNLPRALLSVKDFADEVVVVDMFSEDETVKIAKDSKAKVYSHKKTGYVEPARNYAIQKAGGDWIFILDADEEMTTGLKKTLKKIIKNPTADYFRVPRKNIIFSKWIKHSRWWPDYNIRFFRKGFVSWNEVIHSVPMTKGKGLDLEASEENAIVHHNYESIEQYINRTNRYSSIQAKDLVDKGYKFDWKDLIQKPSSEFLSRYFQAEGYKDGVHGLALSLLQAFSELAVYLKTWLIVKKDPENVKINVKDVVGEMKEVQSNLNYWQADALFKYGGGLKQKIKRKLKIR